MVDVEFVSKVENVDEPFGLSEIKSDPKLSDMELIRYGRLSVQSVKKSEFVYVKKLAGL
jgi:predicted RNA-binding protein with PUA-like domain